MASIDKMSLTQEKMSNQTKTLGGVKRVHKHDNCYLVSYFTGELAELNILNNHVFRYFVGPTGLFPEYPTPINPEDQAKINSKRVSDYDTKAFEKSDVNEIGDSFIVSTYKVNIMFDKIKGTMTVFDKQTNKEVFTEIEPVSYGNNKVTQVLSQRQDEFFFGGGMQNGRFSHKGETINIVNENKWVDGGVTSPCPFYWSSYGYAILRNTWQQGTYDFGFNSGQGVKNTHDEFENFDAFFFINPLPKDILNDYFELTGRPIFMPEYAFYEAHLNAFNRDYWVKVNADTPGAILFEDGFYYKSYQPKDIKDKTDAILESLNGEKNNYQFSARAMIDRYKKHDIPIGWFVPNDGYGSGYGQTDSLDGDIENLREFGDYARKHGIEIALWTESQLEPKDPDNPKKGERDLSKEVGVAGVMALKCDVAWIGDGYSFGLSAVENAANIFKRTRIDTVRPMVIMVDGWAGTQRFAGIWSGDQTGGQWEYIRFHIPTYIGSGLSGQPIVGSDMDGIYGGKLREVNIRDFQWKTFTPLQLNMDGWGHKQKTPFSFNEEATAINRAYLKLKSMLMPYNYTLGYESTHGLPMVRAMFLEFPKDKPAYTKDSQYQFMWGPNILVAPIYNSKGVFDASMRDGIYLPDNDQVWIDFFTGQKFIGGKIYNNIKVPLWKIPVFIKNGAIIPMVDANNNPNEIKRDNRIFTLYPNGKTTFDVYEDDGISSLYLKGHFAKTKITLAGPLSYSEGDLLINIHKAEGKYKKMVKERTTVIQIMTSKDIKSIKTAINGVNTQLHRVEKDEDFQSMHNVFYYKKDFIINPYLNDVSTEIWHQKFLLIKLDKLDVTENEVHIKVKGYENKGVVFGDNNNIDKSLDAPSNFTSIRTVKTSSTKLHWDEIDEASYYEIERDGDIFTNITGSSFVFDDMPYETIVKFRIRSVHSTNVSEWSDPLLTVTGEHPFKYTVKGVKVTCNVPCQPGQNVSQLCDGDTGSMWHTKWFMPHQADEKTGKTIKLNFDLGDVYEIEKFEYHPRFDAGNGTLLKIQYKYSVDGEKWSSVIGPIDWEQDDEVKSVDLSGNKMRFFEIEVFKSVTGFGAGRHILFFNKK